MELSDGREVTLYISGEDKIATKQEFLASFQNPP